MKRKFRFPLWVKAFIVLTVSVLLVSVTAIIFSSLTLVNITRSHYVEHSREVADTYALYLNTDDVKAVQTKTAQIFDSIPDEEKVDNTNWDTPEWKKYLANFNDVVAMPEYARLLKQTEDFHSKNDARYIYIGYADLARKKLVYLVDDSIPEERCLPGSFDAFTDMDMDIESHYEEGFYPEVTDTPEYGHLVSVGRPVFDEDHKVVAFAMVELSMDKIIAKETTEIWKMALILGSLGIVAILGGYVLVMVFAIRPIRKLTKVANEYSGGNYRGFDKFSQIEINTRDEIEDLADSMKKMEGDLNKYIHDVLSAEKKADEMKHIADIDAMTGVGNKRAYFEKEDELNGLIKNGDAFFVLTMIDLNELKETNDNLGHEKGDELIVSLCKKIQETFSSSSVYRVGGDEFVVVSLGEVAKETDRLEKELSSSLEETASTSLPISAAIGSAAFDPRLDNNVEDTFKRADAIMYEHKRQMKDAK